MMFTVIGEALIDLVAGADGRFTAHPGGSPLNVAVGLARLGQPTALLARLSTGTFGARLRQHAEANGVDLRWASTATEPASLAVVSTDDNGQPSYDFYVNGTADWQWQPDELRLPVNTQVLHTGSLATWRAPGDVPMEKVLIATRAAGTTLISYDPNVRPALLGDPAAGRQAVRRFVAVAHVVKASVEDLRWLYPDTSPWQVARDWLASGGPKLVIVTDGHRGCRAFTGAGEPVSGGMVSGGMVSGGPVSGGMVSGGMAAGAAHSGGPLSGEPLDVPAVAVRVVDTVGAGDAFTAALLDGLARAGVASPDRLSRLSRQILAEVVRRAALAAALTCQRPGADPPTIAQLSTAKLHVAHGT